MNISSGTCEIITLIDFSAIPGMCIYSPPRLFIFRVMLLLIASVDIRVILFLSNLAHVISPLFFSGSACYCQVSSIIKQSLNESVNYLINSLTLCWWFPYKHKAVLILLYEEELRIPCWGKYKYAWNNLYIFTFLCTEKKNEVETALSQKLLTNNYNETTNNIELNAFLSRKIKIVFYCKMLSNLCYNFVQCVRRTNSVKYKRMD